MSPAVRVRFTYIFSHSNSYYYPSLPTIAIRHFVAVQAFQSYNGRSQYEQMPNASWATKRECCRMWASYVRLTRLSVGTKIFLHCSFQWIQTFAQSIVFSPMKTNRRLRSDSWMAVTASESSGDSTSLSSIFSSSSSSLLLDYYYHYIILIIRGRRIRTNSLQREQSVFNVL